MTTPRELALRRRLKEDFPFYAERCLHIRTKAVAKGNHLPLLVLNEAQRHIHEQAESQRREKGFVRALLLKARQQGGSTYIQARQLWRTTHTKGFRGFVMAHKDDSTANMFRMAKIFYDNLPDLVKPSRTTSNAKEMEFDKLTSGYKIATAGGRESGRSETTHFLHLSEAAFFPDADATMAAVLETLPDAEGTEAWIESTSAGPSGMFYDMCQQAMKGEGDYILIFTGWFLSPEYSRKLPPHFERTEEEKEYAAEVLEEAKYELSDEQIYWRRLKLQSKKQGLAKFRQEYPSTPEEAFRVEVPNALWKQENIDRFRVAEVPKGEGFRLARVVVGVDPSGGKKKRNDEQGIVAGALGTNGHVYILEDGSCKLSPDGWGTRTKELYDRHKADRVVQERNFGGDMVEYVLKSIDPMMATKDVVASRGKAVRAEPVAALYEQGMVHHVGVFLQLEDEMVTWNPNDPAVGSPNRMDALVWVVTELLVKGGAGLRVASYEV